MLVALAVFAIASRRASQAPKRLVRPTEMPAVLPPRAARPSCPDYRSTVSVQQDLAPHDRIREMSAVLRWEPAERRVGGLMSYLLAARSPVEGEVGLNWLVIAGPPEMVWEALCRVFREGDLAILPAVAARMTMLEPSALVTEMADVLSSRSEAARQIQAVAALRRAAQLGAWIALPAGSTLAYPGLDNPDRGVRRAALETLEEMGNQTLVGRLREFAGAESDPELRQLAERAASRSESR